MSVPASEDANALKNLGEMCLQIQAGFYKKILPGYFTPIRSYKVATLKKDIEKLSKTVNEKAEARKRWEDLKSTLQLKEEDFEEALDALQEGYNRSHNLKPPNLNVKVLKESAESLERQKILKGWISLERVNGLIDIWKNLVDCGEKA
ncbi:uncharacterized protein LOC116304624 [Actinia tenebrosa]|uniref:Uncharacterized protein LOC116304624 n=1 Tax=Actinia tenebrosa TaxID=6105 RepID=A0A6P8IVY6_ACTTE|nr:uncharacterized protein LOC116304624 [Actinia tenebrosa]